VKESRTYSEGDWIVHSYYGVGQIKGVEVKGISGEETSYYRIETTDSTFWMPVDQINGDKSRALSDPEEIRNAISTLQMPPKEMSSNYKTRQSRIQRVLTHNTPQAVARLIRDLRARQRDKGPLNGTEHSALRNLKQRLIEEWAIVTGIRTERAASKLERLLDSSRESADSQGDGSRRQKSIAADSPVPSHRRFKWGTWPKQQTNQINR